ncbi:hypothetical protein NKG94_02460 [Micromonospora sp. M12]
MAYVAPAGHLAGDLDPPLGCRAHRRDDSGHSLDVLEHADVRTVIERGWCGRPAPRRRRRSRVISAAYLDTLANHPAVSIVALADLDASRSAAVAAGLPAPRR